jgi:hypothetical protein
VLMIWTSEQEMQAYCHQDFEGCSELSNAHEKSMWLRSDLAVGARRSVRSVLFGCGCGTPVWA